MRISSLIIGLLLAYSGAGQLIIKSIPKLETRARSAQTANDIAQASLPFWDDFSISEFTPDGIRVWGNDTTTQWDVEASKDVYVNATLAKNPPTYKVVTFDGLKGDGSFHGDGRGLTDQLVSDSIDLSAYNEGDDIYLSFYWQAGGNVEVPEKGDSLVLQFFDPAAETQWGTIWLIDGEDVEYDSVFYQERFMLTQNYLTNQFRFRFQAYGDQNGPFDAWHVDYIYLNDDRANDDYFYLDRGFTGQLTSPLTPFNALPVNQLRANLNTFTGPQTAQAFNLDRFIQPTEYVVVLRELVNQVQIDANQYGSENPLQPNPNALIHNTERILTFDGFDLTGLPNQDSLILSSTLYIESSDDDFLDGTVIDLRDNDTLRAEYLFHDFYAYDDGTAEYAVGNNIRGGKVGVQYWVEEQDTLTHIDFYFPNIAPSSDGSSLTLRIYNDLETESVMRTQPITITTGKSINEFTRYALNRPLIVTDTFYITYEQNVNQYVGIGFDRSNHAASEYIFDNIGDVWVRNDRLKGALMIRPVFKSVADFTLGAIDEMEQPSIYPNPTEGLIAIQGDYLSIQVHNLSGQLLLSELKSERHDLEKNTSGIIFAHYYNR